MADKRISELDAATWSSSLKFAVVEAGTTKEIDAGKFQLTTTAQAAAIAAAAALPVATQAQMEAATAASATATPAVLQYHPGVAKALAKVRVSGATITVLRSYNIASVSAFATGDFNVRFSTPFSDANYVMNGNARSSGTTGGADRVVSVAATVGQTTSACRITIQQAGGALADPSEFYVTFFGDQ